MFNYMEMKVRIFARRLVIFVMLLKLLVDENFDMNNIEVYSDFCKYYLFDTFTKSYGGSGKKFNWDLF